MEESGQIKKDWLKATSVILAKDDCALDQVGIGGGADK